MTNLEQHLQKGTQNMRLTDAEKSAMRMRLSHAMGAPAVPVSTAPMRSPYMWLFAPRSIAMAAVAFLLVISTGTSYAAEGALPGGVFYPVKTNVLEPLSVALATTPAAKAQANATIATTRVEEAQILAAKGKLTPEAAQQISDNYAVHAEAALALAKDVDEDSDVVVAVATIVPAVGAEPSNEPVATTLAVSTTDASTTVDVDAEIHPTAMTFSAKLTSAPRAASTTAASTTNANNTGKAAKNLTATSSSSDVENVGSLSSKLGATFSIQVKILEHLTAEAREHQTKTPR